MYYIIYIIPASFKKNKDAITLSGLSIFDRGYHVQRSEKAKIWQFSCRIKCIATTYTYRRLQWTENNVLKLKLSERFTVQLQDALSVTERSDVIGIMSKKLFS